MFSAAGAAIGGTVGALAIPITIAVAARPPLAKSTPTLSAPPNGAEPRAWHRGAAVVVPVVACGMTGARIGTGWVLPGFLAVGVGLGAAGLIDARWRLLPKRIVYPTWFASLVGMAAAATAHHHYMPLAGAAGAGIAVFIAFAVISLVAPKAMAFGDVRLAGLAGSALGWWGTAAVVGGLAVSFMAAGIVSVALIVAGRASLDTPVPLGSWLAAGTLITIWAVAS